MIEDPRPLTATPGSMLQSALARLRLDGAIFFRAELTEGFAFDSTPAEVAGLLHPGAERLILFHIVAQGSCWVAGSESDRHRAGPGDVIVVPYGDRHTIGGEAPAEPVQILTLLDGPPLDGRRPGGRRGRLPLPARRALPPRPRPLADPLPHRVAHAPRPGAAGHHPDRVATVARRVGYDSEEAFSRAFKRASGQSPSHWRLARAADPGR
jgi:AraC-like DNA-binding protein